jgi:large subunit ribosomal protein L4e
MQGKGISRVPRKIMSRRGSQFNWEGAEIPNARGGRRAHPPKIDSMINTKKINKKELVLALKSALIATITPKMINQKYQRLNDKKVEGLPFIIEPKFLTLKTKQQIESLKNILGKDLIEVSLKKKKVRSGKGKLRGRKYKQNAGMLLVIGEKEKTKINAIDVKKVKELSIMDLAQGGLGRITMYTEQSLNEIDKKFSEGNKQ